ncbi:sensor domain-containing protein [Aneurinibacillus danicus]|jgi:diguanylate cyclase (GGDEF)-like protein|uniref:Bifunctional diguanylate cyclase/phosphodiesterase n=1 Tax=Aneurinibacillus danicus TaxID=267746 RepID=A0A511V6Q0_9BACL|nr:EAL domain-containing protein [Aneurinibacillus danicus]GEN33821.1 bifunctional diguanylate cyclase/phosphodiesterase [Aneurinibacillus danicus]
MQNEAVTSLQQTEKHYRRLLEKLHNVVYKVRCQAETDAEFIYTMFEGRVAKQQGLTTEAVRGKTPQDLFAPRFAAYLQAQYKKAWRGESVIHEFTCGDETYYVSLLQSQDEEGRKELIGCSLDLTLCRQAKQKIEHMQRYDALTGLPNQLAFDEYLYQAVEAGNVSGSPFTLMIVDIDKFKMMHAAIGRTPSEAVLAHVAEKLSLVFEEGTVLARLSKDNFAILIQGMDCEEARLKAVEIISLITSPIQTSDTEIHVTASIGISIYPADGDSPEEVLKKAETAMYRAKERGGNCYCFYSHEMTRIGEQWVLRSELRNAVQRGELFLHYQPRYAVRSKKLVGMEALVRWLHPESGVLFPGKFIELAEKTGLILEIDRWVLEAACARMKKWKDLGNICALVSVNLSYLHFKELGCVQMIMNTLRKTGLAPECLEIELTESVFVEDPEVALEAIRQLKALGVRIAIDDFGTGYSALHYLKKFPFDTLKIDRSFLENVTVSEADGVILQTVIDMAKKLNLRVVAEGVETEEQLSYLRAHACDEVQGYLLGRPVPEEQMEKLLLSMYN